MDAFFSTHAVTGVGVWKLEWPDKGGYQDQANWWLDVVKVCKDEIARRSK